MTTKSRKAIMGSAISRANEVASTEFSLIVVVVVVVVVLVVVTE